MSIAPAVVANTFRARYGKIPRLFRAPGRINVIGEHTDYSGGFVMPAAIDRHCWIAAAPNNKRTIAVHAADLDKDAALDLDALQPAHDWTDYIAGVAATLHDAGIAVPGCDLWIESDVPIGAGVSSSAAIEVAVAHALLAVAHKQADAPQIARWAQAAENNFVGMPCGIMDQFASANGVAGSALLLDCRSLAFEPLPIPDSTRFLLVNSMTKHTHVEGEYRRRREDCETAAKLLGVPQLRDVSEVDLPRIAALPDGPAKRARHVVTENARVQHAATAFGAADMKTVGRLMNESHASLRDDMEVSAPNVDKLTAIAQRTPSVLGARMMGGGFGGCIIALVEAAQSEPARKSIVTEYSAAIGKPADSFICRAVAGAGEVTL